eukprot:gnl/MRDRNA2_/MRDRNA2_117568_c0_seq1.p1 gnl/MRDRNA2_/MRDRNA2_117568_c0~~gnl/MRDRNA2_/MRDRNA2_117568_c0_seq1.p1  ORF type:complete len:603 (+),score=88.87 gnl/MRDRNA2_/MRDRNA2_117568_c0_seq1:79-1887(+)
MVLSWAVCCLVAGLHFMPVSAGGQAAARNQFCRFSKHGQLCDHDEIGISLLQSSASSRQVLEGRRLTDEALMQRENELNEREAMLRRREDELRKKEALSAHHLSQLDLHDDTAHVHVTQAQYLHNDTLRTNPDANQIVVMLPRVLSSSPPDIALYLSTWLSTRVGFLAMNLFLVLLCTCLSLNGTSGEAEKVLGAGAIHRDMMRVNWSKDKNLATLIDQGMEIERHKDVSCFAMFTNQPWHHRPASEVIVKNPGPNKEWRDGELFPGGGEPPEDHEPRLRHFVFHFWKFLFFYKKPYFSLFMMVLCGILPPIQAIIFSWIADGIGPNGNVQEILRYVLLFGALHFAKDRAYYLYQIDVPLASVRWEFRHRLQRQFLVMKGELASTWPAGRAIGLMDHDVHMAVNWVWKAIFQITQHISAMVALFAVTVWLNWKLIHYIRWPIMVVWLALLTSSIGIVRGRHHVILDLAKRKRDWRLGWMDVASKQIDDVRDGRLQQSLDDAQLEFGKAAFLYRSRAFHSFFGLLTAKMCMSEMVTLTKCLLAFFGCALAIQGKLTTGQALALLKVGDLTSKALSGLVEVAVQIRAGYVSLVDIAEVLNADVV